MAVRPDQDERGNAESIWQHARGAGDQFGQVWSGPFTGASAGTQASALDALIAAAQLARAQAAPPAGP